jgi:hypothetical protein
LNGHKFEAARINYNGDWALSWQRLWFGPWRLDGILDGATDVSERKVGRPALEVVDSGWRKTSSSTTKGG